MIRLGLELSSSEPNLLFLPLQIKSGLILMFLCVCYGIWHTEDKAMTEVGKGLVEERVVGI